MKVLSIGSDRKLFEERSASRERIIEYGKLFEELHVVVFSRRRHNFQLPITNYQSNSKIQISKNVFLYPTNSLRRFLYVLDAYKIGRQIIGNWKLEIGNSRHDIIVTAQDPFESGLAGWLIARKFRLPLQLQIHTDFISPYFRRGSFLNLLRVHIAKFLVPRAACIRVVSKRIKDSLKESRIKNQESRIHVLPIFVDTKKVENSKSALNLRDKYHQFDFIILMVSRLTREKNILLALEAFKKVVTKYPQTGLLIIGDGPDRGMLESQVTSYKLQDSVVFEGWQNDLLSYYKTADAYLLTSNYEGYGRTLVEAAVAGSPIVTADVGLVGDVLKDKESALVCPPRDVGCIAKHLVCLREDLALRRQLSENARQAVLRIMMPKEEYLKKYKEAIEHCGR